eukprot:COSAG06_NODE_6871_length_2735_cov_2.515554_2_plen_447_part_00
MLIFSPTTWDVPQNFSVHAVDDNTIEGTHVLRVNHSVTSDDTRYHLEHQLLGRFTVIDADTASVVVRSPPVVVEGQPAVEMCFALSARVTAAVAILVENGVAVNDTVDYSEIAFVSGLSVNGSDSISLNETTWQTGDCVMVYAPEDDVAEGARTFTVRYELSSLDRNYDGQSDLVVVSVDDNDSAALVIVANTTVLQPGESVHFTAELTSQPITPVTFVANVFDADVLDVYSMDIIGLPLIFDPQSWSAPRELELRAHSDGSVLRGGQYAFVLTHVLQIEAATPDPLYAALAPVVIEAEVFEPAMTIFEGSCDYGSGDGSSMTFPVSTVQALVLAADAVALAPPNTVADELAGCFWKTGDGTGGTERRLGAVSSHEACSELVRVEEPTANGATVTNGGSGSCYAEFGMSGNNDSPSWSTCAFGEAALSAFRPVVRDVCFEPASPKW